MTSQRRRTEKVASARSIAAPGVGGRSGGPAPYKSETLISHFVRSLHDERANRAGYASGMVAAREESSRADALRNRSALLDAAAEVLAETMARLGLSFVLTRDTVVPVDDPAAMRRTIRSLLTPLLTPA